MGTDWPELLSVGEVAKYLHVSKRTARKLINKKAFPASKVEGQYRVNRTEVDAYLERATK